MLGDIKIKSERKFQTNQLSKNLNSAIDEFFINFFDCS